MVALSEPLVPIKEIQDQLKWRWVMSPALIHEDSNNEASFGRRVHRSPS